MHDSRFDRKTTHETKFFIYTNALINNEGAKAQPFKILNAINNIPLLFCIIASLSGATDSPIDNLIKRVRLVCIDKQMIERINTNRDGHKRDIHL